jgi:hypothetical protein
MPGAPAAVAAKSAKVDTATSGDNTSVARVGPIFK